MENNAAMEQKPPVTVYNVQQPSLQGFSPPLPQRRQPATNVNPRFAVFDKPILKVGAIVQIVLAKVMILLFVIAVIMVAVETSIVVPYNVWTGIMILCTLSGSVTGIMFIVTAKHKSRKNFDILMCIAAACLVLTMIYFTYTVSTVLPAWPILFDNPSIPRSHLLIYGVVETSFEIVIMLYFIMFSIVQIVLCARAAHCWSYQLSWRWLQK